MIKRLYWMASNRLMREHRAVFLFPLDKWGSLWYDICAIIVIIKTMNETVAQGRGSHSESGTV